MRKVLALFFCLLLLPLSAGAEDMPRARARDAEKALLESGLELQAEWTFEWGDLKMLTQEENRVLESLLSQLQIVTRVMRQGDAGYSALDLYLQRVSVLDMAMRASGGQYLETSSLIGGQTVAFTPEGFSTFVRRVAERSEGALLSNVDRLFDLALLLCEGRETALGTDAAGALLFEMRDWAERALTEREVRRPRVSLPGVYGQRARVADITRAELIELARQVEAVLMEDANEGTTATGGIESLPNALERVLPEDMPPIELRTVYGLEGTVVSRQLEAALPGGAHLFLEWDWRPDGIAALYASLQGEGGGLSARYTRERSEPYGTGKVVRSRQRDIAEVRLFAGDVEADLIFTRHQNAEIRADKEIITGKTELMLLSDALLGEETLLTLSLIDTTTASGEGKKYRRKAEHTVYLKGLGFDNEQIIKISCEVTPGEAAFPAGLGDDAAIQFPASFSDAALDAWIAGVQQSLLDGGFAILGRLPPIVAMYVLENWL